VPPPNSVKRRIGGDAGSASLELVGVLPFLLLAILVAAQLAVAGASLWSAGLSARAGARASLVGGRAETAARAALPSALRDGARVRAGKGAVTVEVPLPRLLPGLPAVGIGAATGLGGGG
jgi:pilus assembly protein CpaE